MITSRPGFMLHTENMYRNSNQYQSNALAQSAMAIGALH
ncbi:hypothetical protein PA08_0918 [Cutibacterium modestum P08]|nr:hypothetical protein PA08_0918 [Cutibacterium modestum P08]